MGWKIIDTTHDFSNGLFQVNRPARFSSLDRWWFLSFMRWGKAATGVLDAPHKNGHVWSH